MLPVLLPKNNMMLSSLDNQVDNVRQRCFFCLIISSFISPIVSSVVEVS